MKNINEVNKALDLINKHPENIAWQDFTDNGNPCYNPYSVSSDEMNEEADSRAAVLKAMPKNSLIHLSISQAVARLLGTKWVTYDWLSKIIGRIIAPAESYHEFEKVIALSVAVQQGMRERGLTTINSIEEAFQ
jgi:hypothetical protein